MKIEPSTPGSVYTVALHMRPRDFDEMRAFSAADDREAMADGLAARYGGRPDVYCVAHDGQPVCVAAAIEAWPNVVSLLFFATEDFPKVALPVTRFLRRELFPRYDAGGVHRIQAMALAGYDEVDRWLRMLGLQPETGPLPGYGRHGEAFIQYARVRDVRATGA